ncbi:PASTA domain-containing protein [Phaeocystidibacter luteus]|uniref:PASTA domain-containing protein n=1 Tax=Phaeocystidibacter luteus TaxID=911197 RepID=A0A6N6RKG5_9FLAO|nr:PASTA domain-containing protein [Phaeocystidibacter luteus]KAB2806812.1 PASTA domain-containing protein [Phaeocystidibacter luteus]
MKLIRFLKSRTLLFNLIVMLVVAIAGIWVLNSWLDSITDHGEVVIVPDLQGKTLSMVEEDLEDLNLSFEVLDSSEFSRRFEPGSVVDQYPVAGAEVKRNRTIKLTLNPMHERKLALPAIVDIPRVDAQFRLESRGFAVGEVRYVPDIAKDNVLWVELDGMKINDEEAVYSKGTAFDLVCGAGLSNERTFVPRLYNMSLDSAERKLNGVMLNIGSVLYDEDLTDTASARIYKQVPGPNPEFVIRMGDGVDLWLTNDSTKIPKMTFQPDTTVN